MPSAPSGIVGRGAGLAAALVLLSARANAEQEGVLLQAEEVRRSVESGVTAAEFRRVTPRGLVTGQWLEVDARVPGIVARVQTARQGIWGSSTFAGFAEGAESLAGFALAFEPGVTETPPPQGLLFTDGAVWSWPGTGPGLVLRADGSFDVAELSGAGPGTITLDSGTTATLANVNGGPTQGAFSLVSGPFSGASRAGSAWPAGAIALPLRPSPENRAPARAMWDEWLTPEERRWTPGTPMPLNRLNMQAGEWALAASEGYWTAMADALRRARHLTIHVPLAGEVALSLGAVQGEGWLLRDGVVAAEDASTAAPVRSVLATDVTGRSLFVVDFGDTRRGRLPVTRADLAELLLDHGAADAVELPVRASHRLLWNRDAGTVDRDLAGVPVRAVLAISRGERALPLAEGNAAHPIGIAFATGSNATAALNGPAALHDGRSGPDPAAGQFWAAIGPAWFEVRLESLSNVGAMDLVHAEAAGFSPEFDLRGFRLLARPDSSVEWTTIAERHHGTPLARERMVLRPPIEAGELRLEVTEPNFLPGGTTARLAEVQVWGEP
ncbi:hypothetical protein HZA57_00115 [Candidatus Poribacteria bacterium]|nr:hypothetical protein [Candidatus Poribacteria bacterium]